MNKNEFLFKYNFALLLCIYFSMISYRLLWLTYRSNYEKIAFISIVIQGKEEIITIIFSY